MATHIQCMCVLDLRARYACMKISFSEIAWVQTWKYVPKWQQSSSPPLPYYLIKTFPCYCWARENFVNLLESIIFLHFERHASRSSFKYFEALFSVTWIPFRDRSWQRHVEKSRRHAQAWLLSFVFRRRIPFAPLKRLFCSTKITIRLCYILTRNELPEYRWGSFGTENGSPDKAVAEQNIVPDSKSSAEVVVGYISCL